MKSCQNNQCPLWQKMVEVPFEKGKKNDIVWMGESPGKWEERKGKPFWYEADAGGLLRECLQEVSLDYGDYFWANSTRCRMDTDALSGKEITEILSACHNHAVAPIRLLRPKAVVLMGNYALRQVLKRSGITKHRGRWLWDKEFKCWILPIFHPAFILRNMGLKKRLVDDFRMVKEFIDNDYAPPKVNENRLAGYKEINSLDSLLERWAENGETVGFDTEGQGLDWMDPNFLLISCSFSPTEDKAFSLTFYEETEKGKHDFTITWPRKNNRKKAELTTVYIRKAKDFSQKVQALANFLSNNKIKKYMMHGNFDLHAVEQIFKREKMLIPKVRNYTMDIQAAANIIDENMFKLSSLEELQMAFTNVQEDYKSDFQKKYDVGDMLAIPKMERSIYSCGDADITRRVGISIKNDLLNDGNYRLANYLAKFTMPALGFLRILEINGALIDQEKLPQVTKDVYGTMIAAEDRALALIPNQVMDDFGITSSEIKEARRNDKFFLTRDDLVATVLFGRHGFGLNGIKKTASKERWSIDKETRITLLDSDVPCEVEDFIDAYDDFSEDNTMWSRYLKGFGKNIKTDGRIHSSYLLCVAVNGRVASRGPNMMNNPKKSRQAVKIRELICAPPGYVLVAADEAASELRWGTAISKDEEFMRIFQNDLDPHAEVALTFLKRKDPSWTQERWNKLNKRDKELERRKAKASNFGLWYGQGLKGFMRFCKKEYGLVVSEEEAKEWMSIWFGRFKRVQEYQKNMIQHGIKYGYVESPLGRRRRLPDLKSRDPFTRGNAERMAMNTPISSASSDTVLLVGNEIEKRIVLPTGIENPKEIRPILFVHDELTFEVKEDKVNKWISVIKEAMEHPPLERDFHYHMPVPLKAEVSVGKNLASLQEA